LPAGFHWIKTCQGSAAKGKLNLDAMQCASRLFIKAKFSQLSIGEDAVQCSALSTMVQYGGLAEHYLGYHENQ
jgi:hypothetical protein